MEYVKVKAVKDDSGHWFLLPNEKVNSFYRDLENENLVDSGEFGNMYGGYATGGDLNLIQLYVERKE